MRTPCAELDSCISELVVLEPSRVRVLRPSYPKVKLDHGYWEVGLPDDLERPAELVGVVHRFPCDEKSCGPLQAAMTDSLQLSR